MAELPAPEEGWRLALWQGEGRTGTPVAVEENLQLLTFLELYLSGYVSDPGG